MGLSEAAVNTIQHSHATSTSAAYKGRWCEDRVDPNHVSWLGMAMYCFTLCLGLFKFHRKSLTEVCCFAV